MNSKKLVSIIVLVAATLLIALIIQSLGDKTYERNEYARPVPPEQLVTAEERAALAQKLESARVNAEWQATKLSILRGTVNPDRIAISREEVVKTKAVLKKALTDSYTVAQEAVKKGDIPFVQAKKEIAETKKQINTLLVEWKNNIDAGTPPSVPTVNGYLNSIQEYLEDVQEILENITPEGSGLTQEQIDEYIEDIEESIAEVTNTITNLNQAQTIAEQAEEILEVEESAGNPAAIAEQTQAVIDSQAEVAELEETIAEDTSPQAPIETYIPDETFNPNLKLIPLFDPSKPHLLQD